MVPGMTERERLAADMRRLEWLSDAVIGPTWMAHESGLPEVASGSRPVLPFGTWRRGLASALVFGKRVRLLQPRASASQTI